MLLIPLRRPHVSSVTWMGSGHEVLTTCIEPGCETLVLGGRCLEHERPQTRIFVRGRPFEPARATPTAPAGLGTIRLVTPTRVRVPTLTRSASLH